MGLEFDGGGIGLGVRSQRYAAVIEDGVITSLDVESKPGVDVSSCEWCWPLGSKAIRFSQTRASCVASRPSRNTVMEVSPASAIPLSHSTNFPR